MQTVGDDAKRKAYDQYGPASQQAGFDANEHARASAFHGGAGGFGDFFGGGSRSGGSANGDMFDSIFGAFGARAGGARTQNFAGDDMEATITVDFLEACRGVKRAINYAPIILHTVCSGTGIKPGYKKQTCPNCKGSGQVTYVVSGGFTVAASCSTCQGQGSSVPREGVCAGCDGLGRVRESKAITVTVPAGVDDGMRLRMTGQGNAPMEGKGRNGDLNVQIKVLPSKIFRRQGANIFLDRSIPFYTAILGGTVRIPTLDQEVDIRVPSGTQPGEEVVLKGRGIQKVGRPDAKGDLAVKFNVSVPRSVHAALSLSLHF